jgi:hypothetical protein
MSRPRRRPLLPRARRPRPERAAGNTRALRFRADGTFTIVQLTDLHWCNGEAPDLRTRALVEAVVDAERPDLVVLTGDVVSGDAASDPAAAYRAVVAPLEARGLAWCAVFGNHDDEGSRSRRELLAVQRAHAHCLTEPGPARLTGVGNYVLEIRSARAARLAGALYFLDSGSYPTAPAPAVGQYAWIARDQISWFLEASRRLRTRYHQGRAARTADALPSLAFFHIPLPEWDEVWRTQVCRGTRGEPVCSPALNSGFFTAMVEAGDVMGAFCGHDHLNDYEGELHGIRLCYGRASGFSPYGRDGFAHGARVVKLQEGRREFQTWLRLEDGTALTDPPAHEPEAWTALTS